MGVEEFLAPGETVRFASRDTVTYQDQEYEFYITDRRLIWFSSKGGLILKKKNLLSVPIEQVRNVAYEEKGGLVKKRARIEIIMADRRYEFSGTAQSMRAIYGELQAHMVPAGGKQGTQ
ncbi:PH domain-containing protein [Thermogymnomonas acidicola]|uniref:PH domain-containing protein n=1 Tax=Thermogymnomonas acidicola TaxID=399579 RepID=UPI00139688E6|nr:PH domain-containing protein [Thermogymnomonas acidicola]